eukprot:gene8433-biopygen19641
MYVAKRDVRYPPEFCRAAAVATPGGSGMNSSAHVGMPPAIFRVGIFPRLQLGFLPGKMAPLLGRLRIWATTALRKRPGATFGEAGGLAHHNPPENGQV